jgi:capsid protein
VPWVAPAMVRLLLLDQYDDVELDRKKVAAMFAGFVKQAVDQQFARWVMLHVQSNPLPICTRPRVP